MLHLSDSHCWETTPHGSLTFVYMLNAQALLSDFILDYFFKDICMANNLKDKDSVSLWNKGQVYLLSIIINIMSLVQSSGRIIVHYKIFGFSKLGIPLL